MLKQKCFHGARRAGGRSGASEGKFRLTARWEDAVEWAIALGLCWCTGLVPTRDLMLCGSGLTPLALRRRTRSDAVDDLTDPQEGRQLAVADVAGRAANPNRR
jgi:hypothetical protein